jgi:hypothetical protein
VKEALEKMLQEAPPICKGRYFGAYGVYDIAMKKVFHDLFRNRDLPTEVNGKFSIALTRLSLKLVIIPGLKDEIVDKFHSNADIIECIISSAMIPFALNGFPCYKYRDWWCIDGGIFNITGIHTEKCVYNPHNIPKTTQSSSAAYRIITDEIINCLKLLIDIVENGEFMKETQKKITSQQDRKSKQNFPKPYGIKRLSMKVIRVIIER